MGAANLRAGVRAAVGGSVCASERRTVGRTRVDAGLAPPRVWTGLKLTRGHSCLAARWPPEICSCTDGRRWGPGALGLAGRGRPSPPEPALPPETQRRP